MCIHFFGGPCISASRVLRLGSEEMHKILDEIPEGRKWTTCGRRNERAEQSPVLSKSHRSNYVADRPGYKETRQPLQSGNIKCLYALTGMDSLPAAVIVRLWPDSHSVQLTWLCTASHSVQLTWLCTASTQFCAHCGQKHTSRSVAKQVRTCPRGGTHLVLYRNYGKKNPTTLVNIGTFVKPFGAGIIFVILAHQYI